jgi:hypothetical protein
MVKHGQNYARIKMAWGLVVAGILMSGASLGSTTGPPAGSDPTVQAGKGATTTKPAAPAKAPAKKKTVAKKTTPKKAGGAPPVPKAAAEKEIAGKRDPFRIPPPPVPGREGMSDQILDPLPPGTRGLVINQLRLEGIVRLDTTNSMIAVVDNSTNRAYFLRENDAVYDGVVSKITPDSVFFRQNYLEPGGSSSVREVVKRLGPGPGEGR